MMSDPTAANRPLKALLSVDKVAKHLSCSVKTVRRLISRGDLPHVRVGKLIRIEPKDVQTYLFQNKNAE